MLFRGLVLFFLLNLMIISGEAEGKKNPIIVTLGDSLTAGYGVEEGFSYPMRLQKRLEENGFPHKVINAGVSGDTTAGGLRRTRWILNQQPELVIIALGANDGLRGVPTSEIKKNLEAIIKTCLKIGAKVILAGMLIPPNYGPEYTGEFREIYPHLAKKYNITFIPFLLKGVAGNKEYNQIDGLHPTKEGYAIVTDTIWQALLPMLQGL